jgi:hypothetical protein
MNKALQLDWTGNSKSVSASGGFSNHSETQRDEHDFYATDPRAVKLLLDEEQFNLVIWENACGQGHLAHEMERLGKVVIRTDLIERHQLDSANMDKLNFLNQDNMFNIGPSIFESKVDIITNPPYKYANEWILSSMKLLQTGSKLALFLPIRYLEGKTRKKLFEKYPPKTVYISSSRLQCAKNGEFTNAPSAQGYAWFVWQKGYASETTIKWFN